MSNGHQTTVATLQTGKIRYLAALSLAAIWLLTGAARLLEAAPLEIIGVPAVMMGDTLEVQGYRVRLFGIDAPEPEQSCRLPHKVYDCGRVAAAALMDLTAGTVVRCIPKRQADDDVLIGICYADGYDLSEGMTYTGWALTLPNGPTRYSELEEGAKNAGRGLWRGEFVMPWDWRNGKRLPSPD
ncbi:MAG: thermonuclease family protein [Kiloniellaceae bacterium]|jgi:endonuclease YncB( thermonuclease family)|nr:thermonuclease family protein [Kiloniellaceae bacterium]